MRLHELITQLGTVASGHAVTYRRTFAKIDAMLALSPPDAVRAALLDWRVTTYAALIDEITALSRECSGCDRLLFVTAFGATPYCKACNVARVATSRLRKDITMRAAA